MKENQRENDVQNPMLKIASCLLVLQLLTTLAGCASRYAQKLEERRVDFYETVDLDKARENLERCQKRASAKEKTPLTLESASLDLAQGKVKDAQTKLRDVRDELDSLDAMRAKATGEKLLSLWMDENASSFDGEDYEKVMIRVYLALTELLVNGHDARAYAFQIEEKQDAIVRGGLMDDPNNEGKKINPKVQYPRLPIGPYLEGILAEETYLEQGEAARCYRKVVEWSPSFAQGKKDVERAEKGVHSQPGNGRLYLFALVGKGPRKEQTYAEATQFALLVADQIFSATSKYSVPPTIAPVPIPEIVVDSPNIASVALEANGEKIGLSETIVDVNEMAAKEFEAVKDLILARAIVRRITKKGTVYVAKEAAQVNPWVSLAADLGGVVWEATETADTRCWGLLPAKIQVLSAELPAGETQIVVYPTDRQGNKIGEACRRTVHIPKNRNAYVMVNYPDRYPVGTILSSGDGSN